MQRAAIARCRRGRFDGAARPDLRGLGWAEFRIVGTVDARVRRSLGLGCRRSSSTEGLTAERLGIGGPLQTFAGSRDKRGRSGAAGTQGGEKGGAITGRCIAKPGITGYVQSGAAVSFADSIGSEASVGTLCCFSQVSQRVAIHAAGPSRVCPQRFPPKLRRRTNAGAGPARSATDAPPAAIKLTPIAVVVVAGMDGSR